MKKYLFLLTTILASAKLFSQTNILAQTTNSAVSMSVDQNNANNGTINPGLSFGSQSGEGISSKRTGGGNQYGLDFYSNFINRMSITNGGKVGIGTTQPQQNLSVGGGMNIDQNNQNPGSYLAGALTFGSSSGEGIGSNRTTIINKNGLDFYTAGLPRVFITNKGDVGIGISAPAAKLHVAGAIISSAAVMPSDTRYKKNILSINSALKTVMALSGYRYLLRTEEFPEMNFDSRTQYGLLAQDVEKVLPEIVYSGNNGYKAIDYTRIIPLLIEGMKEQQQMIEKQQRQINALLKMIEKLPAK